MTRILVDARIGWSSGIGRYSANVVPRVARAMPSTTFDMLVTPADRERAVAATAGIDNLNIVELDIPPFDKAEQWRLPAMARPYDLTWFVNYWVPLRFNMPFIAVVHDMLHLEPSLFPASRAKRFLSRQTFRHLRRRASGIAFVSRFTQREFERLIGVPERSVVCGIGIDHAGWSLFDPDTPPEKKRQILLVAAAKAHKNFRVALQAFLHADIPAEWRMTIVTPDAELRSSIDLEGLVRQAERVEFHTGLSNAALRDLYGDSAIVLMPSLYEGFGLPLIEGLQSGARVISSTAASLVEVGQGASVVYVNPHDVAGWVKAIENECARFDRGDISATDRSAAMRHALSYDWDSVATAMIPLIRDAMAR